MMSGRSEIREAPGTTAHALDDRRADTASARSPARPSAPNRPAAWSSAHLPFRLLLGVTGHRAFADEARIRESVGARLSELTDRFGGGSAAPAQLCIVTALAEGADRILAQEARTRLGPDRVTVEAVLPLTVEDYRTDFPHPASRREFDELLASAADRIELSDRPRPRGPERNAAYERAGRYIVDHCDVLLAVWDGRPGHGPGGTAEVVQYARDRAVPILIVPADDGDPPPVHDGWEVSPEARRRIQSLIELRRRIDRYDRLPVATVSLAQRLLGARDQLTAPATARIAPQAGDVAEWCLPHMVRADLLALRYQSRYRYLALAVHLLAAVAVAAVAMQIVFLHDHPVWLLLEIACLCALVGAVWAGRYGRTHEQWVAYRSLAEAFRSGFFIALTGARDRREIGDDAEPAGAGTSWSQRGFTAAWSRRPRPSFTEADAADLQRLVRVAWLEDQLEFHRRTAARHLRIRNRYTFAIAGLAMVTIALASGHIIIGPRGAVTDWFEFFAIALPGFGAALTGLRENGQHRLHQDRCERTVARLERLLGQSRGSATLQSVRTLTLEIQRVIADEHLDWWGVIEFQDLEIVV